MNIGFATVVICVVAVLGVVVPLATLGSFAEKAGAMSLMRNGGPTQYLVVLLLLVGLVASVVLGALLVRGTRIPPALLLAFPVLPFLGSVFGAWRGVAMTLGAISGASVDVGSKWRILAEGIAESMASDMLGGLAAGGIAAVGAVACILSVFTVRGSPGKLRQFGIAISGLWIAGVFVVAVFRSGNSGEVSPALVFSPFVLTGLLFLTSLKTRSLRNENDRPQAERVMGALVTGMVLAVFGALMIQRAFEARLMAQALSALGNRSLDPSQQMHVLGLALASAKWGPAAYAVHLILGPLTFGMTIFPFLGKGPDGTSRMPSMGNGLVALGVAVVVLGSGAFAVAHERSSSVALLARVTAPQGVNPPTFTQFPIRIQSGFEDRKPVTVKKTDRASPLSAKCSGSMSAAVSADKDATVGALETAVLGTECDAKIFLSIQRTTPPAVVKALGSYAPLATAGDELIFVLGPDDSKAKHKVVVAGGSRPPVNESVDEIKYVFNRTDTIQHAVDVIASFEAPYQREISPTTKRYVNVAE